MKTNFFYVSFTPFLLHNRIHKAKALKITIMNKLKKLFHYKESSIIDLQKVAMKGGVLSTILNVYLNIHHAIFRRLYIALCFLKRHFHINTKKKKQNQKVATTNYQEAFPNIYGSYGYWPLQNTFYYASKKQMKFTQDFSKDTTIVIPIYNGLHHLEKLFPSLFKHTDRRVQIILINDASTDANISTYLNIYKDYSNVSIITNENNIGFVKTINKAMANVHTKYAIWLNTDTVVYENWVNILLDKINKYEKIATITPFTNSGVCFSFPDFGFNNKEMDMDEINNALLHIDCPDVTPLLIHSGTGFCMAINMECWNEIGGLNERDFEKGYGEENDWCFRAVEHGWKNILCPNLYIHHLHGGSFDSNERKKLINSHQKKLLSLHPELMTITHDFFANDPFKIFRRILLFNLLKKKVHIVIDLKEEKNDVSGAIDYANKTFVGDNENSYLFIKYSRFSSVLSIYFNKDIDPNQTNFISLYGLQDIEILFDYLNIVDVTINNFAFYNNVYEIIDAICKLKEKKHFPLQYNFHDYLSICPSFFLIGYNNMPCKIPCGEECNKKCIQFNKNVTNKAKDIVEWRRYFTKLFTIVDKFVFFSEYTKDIVIKQFPFIEKAELQIKPHKSLMSTNHSLYKAPYNSEIMTFAFVGKFTPVKGSDLFLQLTKLLRKRYPNCKFVIVGEKDMTYSDVRIPTYGRYDRDDLGKILTDYKVNLVIYPSINNETFSYVAQELMILNVPLVVLPCGAPSERIVKTNYKNGIVAKNISVNSLLEAVIELDARLKLTN